MRAITEITRDLLHEFHKDPPHAGTIAAIRYSRRISELQAELTSAQAHAAFIRRWSAMGYPQFWNP